MPKLLQINSVCNTGSTGRIAEEIGQVAIASGWESYIAYGRHQGAKSQSHTFEIGGKISSYLHGVQTRIFDREGLGSHRATKKLIRYIDNIKPDIIHLHNIHGYYINYKILFEYLSKLKTPVVWTMHDCWSFTGHCTHFEVIGCNKWLTGCNNCPQKSSYPASLIFDRSKQNYIDKRRSFNSLPNLTLVPVSDWLAGLTKQSFLGENRIQRIHNGVNTSIFKPMSEQKNAQLRLKYNIGEDKFIILGVANIWTPRKGLNDFKQLNKIIDNNTVIVLIGLTSKQIKSLPDGIIGISRTESVSELAEFYNIADVFINPTYEDNFPTTNIEALSCGTPVITYKTGGSVEAVTADTGSIIDQGDITALYNCINQTKSNIAVECRKRAIEYFSKVHRYTEYIKLYADLLQRNQQ